jgi:uncharacterized protein
MTSEAPSQSPPPGDELPRAWWADEMLGRLARYLRIVGLDTAYRPGIDDDEVLRGVISEGRILITRDRGLAHRARGAVLLSSVRIEDQWRELRSHYPSLPSEPRFARCTLCNGRLTGIERTEPGEARGGVPERVGKSGVPLFRCDACGHVYWEGSHTASVRRHLAEWSEGSTA